MVSGEEMVTLTTADGFTLDAFVAWAEGTSKGGLVIVQEIFGVTDQLKAVARSYAENGYDTIVPALFDRVSPKTVVPFDDPDRGRGLMRELDDAKVLLDLDAARGHVDQGRGVSVMGFCWGGGQAYRAACAFDLKASIAFYGTKLAAYLGAPLKCPMLFHFGETDVANTPPELIDRVRQVAGAEVHVYAAGHAFANDARPTYVPEAAVPAHERSLAFLDQHHA